MLLYVHQREVFMTEQHVKARKTYVFDTYV